MTMLPASQTRLSAQSGGMRYSFDILAAVLSAGSYFCALKIVYKNVAVDKSYNLNINLPHF